MKDIKYLKTRRRQVVILLALVLFFGGIFAHAKAETLEKMDSQGILLEKKDNGQEIKIKLGDEVRLKLRIQGGTGYSWYFDEATFEYFDVTGETTEAPAEEEQSKAGGPVWRLWTLKSKKGGAGVIKTDYFRVWEGRAQAAEHFEVRVIIE
jgi:predicted secreted protein